MRGLLFILIIISLVVIYLPLQVVAAESLYIRNIQAVSHNNGQFKISWNTNLIATGGIVYGKDTAYGHYLGSSLNDTYQEVILVGLQPKTTYHFKIIATTYSLTTESFDHTFKTDTWKITESLKIDNLRLVYVGGSSVAVYWTTNRQADSTLEVATFSNYWSSGFKKNRRASSGSKVTEHELTVTGLATSTSYYFRVSSKDKDGNSLTREGQFFSTLANKFGEQEKLTINQIAPASSPDPLISSTVVTFLWHTNRPARGYLEYKPTEKGQGGKVREVGYSKYDHQITVANLQPATTYKFKIFTQDILGKKFTTEERLIRTSTVGVVLGAYTELPAQSSQPGLRYYTEAKRNLALEQKLAQDLRAYLVKRFNGKVPYISQENWFTLVRAFVYGGYPGEAIAQAVKFGGKTVHPMIFWNTWKNTPTYQNYINR